MCCDNCIKIGWYSFIIMSHIFGIWCLFFIVVFSFFSRKYLFRIISIVNILFFKVFFELDCNAFHLWWWMSLSSLLLFLFKAWIGWAWDCWDIFYIIFDISQNIHRFERCLIHFKQSFRWSRRTLSIEKE